MQLGIIKKPSAFRNVVLKASMVVVAHSYDIECLDELDEETGDKFSIVRVWALENAENSPPLVITFRGYRPSCYVELPRVYYPSGIACETKWNETAVHALVGNFKTGPLAAKIVKYEYVKRSKLYYFQPVRNAFDMIHVEFNSVEDMRSFANKIETAASITKEEYKAGHHIVESGGRNPSYAPRVRGRYYGKQFGKMVLRVWEHDTVPTQRKLFTHAGVQFSNWFVVKPDSIIPPSKTSQFVVRELVVNLAESSELSDISKKFFPVAPDLITKIPPSTPLILSFDIESYSDVHNAFPNPEKLTHKAYMISCIFQRARLPGTRKRFLISTADSSVATSDKHPSYTETGTIVDEFITADDEIDMMAEFVTLIAKMDPDIVIGYNIHGFDYRYLDTRFKLLVDPSGEWPAELSRTADAPVKIASRVWKSSGYGVNDTHVLKMCGRLSVDLMPVIKRDHKLTKYKLDVVSKHFLGSDSGKHDVTPEQMFKFYERSMKTYERVQSGELESDSPERIESIADMSRVAAYAIQDSELVIDLFEKMNMWTSLTETSSVAGVTPYETFTRGQQCRVISTLYNMTSQEDTVLDMRKPPVKRKFGEDNDIDEDDEAIIKYEGGYVGSPETGLHDFVHCVDFTSLYPSIMIAYNICLSTMNVHTSPIENKMFSGRVSKITSEMLEAHKNQTSMSSTLAIADGPKISDPRYSFENIQAAAKLENLDGEDLINMRSSKHVNTFDFIQGGADSDDEGENVDEEESDKKKKKAVVNVIPEGTKYTFQFASNDVLPGLLPRMVMNLINERKAVRKKQSELKKQKFEDGSDEENLRTLTIQVLESRQLATKVMANSMYGFLGAQKAGKFPLPEGAMSVTARGRQLIKRVNAYVRDTYGGRIIYGDTDSSMFVLPNQVKKASDCFKWGTRLAKEISDLFPPPLKLELEKSMRILCLKKKKYAALIIKENGDFEDDMYIRGIVLARRDNCVFLKDIYEAILEKILYLAGPAECFQMIMGALSEAFSGNAPVEKFSVVKSLNSNYKAANFNMAVFAAECLRTGCLVQPGERLEYVIVRDQSRIPTEDETLKLNNLGLKMRLVDIWKHQDVATRSELDILYYVGHMIMNPLDQLFSVTFTKILSEYKVTPESEPIDVGKGFCFRPRSNVSYPCSNPIKMTTSIINHTNSVRKRNKMPELTTAEMSECISQISNKFKSVCEGV